MIINFRLYEIENLKKEITATREELNEKLNASDVKKDDIDKFFIKLLARYRHHILTLH